MHRAVAPLEALNWVGIAADAWDRQEPAKRQPVAKGLAIHLRLVHLEPPKHPSSMQKAHARSVARFLGIKPFTNVLKTRRLKCNRLNRLFITRTKTDCVASSQKNLVRCYNR